MEFLTDAIYFLLAAIVAVPICKRLGLGSVLGYMLAGIVIGPLVLGLIEDAESVQHTAELGVVFLLYIIGLELKPSRLWTMRRSVFAVGGAQVLLTGVALSAIAWLLGQAIGPGIVIGFALAMSSTAFALQMLSEREEMTTEHGRAAFGVLLFQDLAVIPLLAIVPLLSIGVGTSTMAEVAEDIGANPIVVETVTETVADTVDDLAGEQLDLAAHGEVLSLDANSLDNHALVTDDSYAATPITHAKADVDVHVQYAEVGENALHIAPVPQESLLWKILEALLVVLGVYVVGRYLLRYVLRYVAYTNNHELFTALSLLTVLGTALLMEQVGLSMALGGFMAGVLLADSEYRHQLEADIEPFKGLLLGLFFIATGMMLSLDPVVEQPLLMTALVLGLVSIKGFILYGIGRLSGMQGAAALALAATLCQGGEFAFVIFIQAVSSGSLQAGVADLLIVVVTLSMVITPLLVMLLSAIQKRRARRAETQAIQPDLPEVQEVPQVIIAGFGRFGQITARILAGHKIAFTALEKSVEQVDYVKKFGNEVYYGDPGRIELLRAAHADEAKVLVIAVDNTDTALRIAVMARQHFPNLTVISRAKNRQHYYQLKELGVKIINRETFASALEVAASVLQQLGFSREDAAKTVQMFRDSDEARLEENFADWQDDEKMQAHARLAAIELQKLFTQDAQAEAVDDEVEYPASKQPE